MNRGNSCTTRPSHCPCATCLEGHLMCNTPYLIRGRLSAETAAMLRRARGGEPMARLAARVGYDRSTIWRLEHAQCRPSRSMACRLADALHLDAEDRARLLVESTDCHGRDFRDY